MRKPPKNKPKQKTLGQSLLDTFFPTRYAPPPTRVAAPLVGWSGLSTDQPPTDPYAWGQPHRKTF